MVLALVDEGDEDASNDCRADDAGYVGAHGVGQQECSRVGLLTDVVRYSSGHWDG